MKHFLLALSFLIIQVSGQTMLDVYRYANLNLGGSARFVGMGGSMGALGGDQSAAQVNPASLGRFSKGNVQGSLRLLISDPKFNNEINSPNINTDFTSLSLVHAANAKKEDAAFKSFQVNLGYIRTKVFHNRYEFNTNNDTISLLDEFALSASGVHPDDLYDFSPYTGFQSWNTWAISTNDNSNYYAELYPGARVNRNVQQTSQGSMGEFNFSLGTNILHKIYLGASMVVPISNLSSTKETTESTVTFVDSSGVGSIFYQEELQQKGVGLAGRIGAIYLPTDWIRIGVAYHTPKRVIITERFKTDMETYRRDMDTTFSSFGYSPEGYYKYEIIVPQRVVASLGFVFFKRLALNLEFDYQNMQATKVKQNKEYPYDYGYLNDIIASNNTKTYNARIGMEFVLTEELKVRAGYGFYDSPSIDLSRKYNRSVYALGLGFSMKNIYVDLAGQFSNRFEQHSISPIPRNADVKQVEIYDYSIQLTIGYRWLK